MYSDTNKQTKLIVIIIESKNGEWIRKIDIIESDTKGKVGKTLNLVEPGGMSKCKGECKAIAKSCSSLLSEEADPDDLSAMLYKNKVKADKGEVRVAYLFYISTGFDIYTYFRNCCARSGQIDVPRNRNRK